MNSMNKSQRINRAVEIALNIVGIIFSGFAWLWRWLFKPERNWFDILGFIFVSIFLVLLAGVIVLVGYLLIYETCFNAECKIQRQVEKIELLQALVDDCVKREITIETCEALALLAIED